jgi:hypothetical protein
VLPASHQRFVALIAFSSEAGTGSRQENASEIFGNGCNGSSWQYRGKQKGRRKAGLS